MTITAETTSHSSESTNHQTKPKSLFKKVKKRKLLPNQRKRSLDDDDEDDDDDNKGENENEKKKVDIKPEENFKSEHDSIRNNHLIEPQSSTASSSTLGKIKSIKRNRKLKSFVRMQKSKMEKLKKKQMEERDEIDEETKKLIEANKDLKERLEGNFASTKSKRSNYGGDDDEDEDEDGGVLRKKHKFAMEQYIQSQMNSSSNTNTNTTHDTAMTNKNESEEHDHNANNTMIKDKKDLYAELMMKSSVMTSSSGYHNTSSTSAHHQQQNTNSSSEQQEDDVGAGGAMLGGTGIAEVILSVEDRLKNIKDTENALIANKQQKQQQQQKWIHARNKHVSSAVARGGFGGNDNDASLSENVSNLGASYAHNYRLHNSEWIENKKRLEKESYEKRSINSSDSVGVGGLNSGTQEYELDKERVGFSARREMTTGTSASGGGGDGKGQGRGSGRYGQSRDDQAMRNFVRSIKRP